MNDFLCNHRKMCMLELIFILFRSLFAVIDNFQISEYKMDQYILFTVSRLTLRWSMEHHKDTYRLSKLRFFCCVRFYSLCFVFKLV